MVLTSFLKNLNKKSCSPQLWARTALEIDIYFRAEMT